MSVVSTIGAFVLLIFALCASKLGSAQTYNYPIPLVNATASCDLNNDGIADMVAATGGSNVQILLGSKAGEMKDGGKVVVNRPQSAIACADLNGDGNPDIIVSTYSSAATGTGADTGLTVFLGDGRGGLSLSATIAFPYSPATSTLMVFDANRDGKLDILAVRGGLLTILVQDSAGGYSQTTLDLAINSNSATHADFNGDGNIDLAFTESATGKVYVFLGNGKGGFALAKTYSTSYTASSIVAADLNNDGKIDLLVGTVDGIYVFGGLGNGSFIKRDIIAVLGIPGPLVLADLNGDGINDLVVSTNGFTGPLCYVLPGSNTGVFGSPTFVPIPITIRQISFIGTILVADFNGDGKPDIAVTNYLGNSVFVLLVDELLHFTHAAIKQAATAGSPVAAIAGDFKSNGRAEMVVATSSGMAYIAPDGKGGIGPQPNDLTGSFHGGGSQFTVTGPSGPVVVQNTCMVTGDFNGDGKLDFASCQGGGALTFTNDGKGNFTGLGGPSYDVFGQPSGQPSAIVAADFDRDGKSDIAMADFVSGQLHVFHNDGNQQFLQQIILSAGKNPIAMVAADVDGDGLTDLVVANNGDGTVMVFRNVGFQQFSPATTIPVGISPVAVAVADFNGDGKLDIAVANLGDNSVSILLNTGTGNFVSVNPIRWSSKLPALSPTSIVVGDFNGDGIVDIALSSYSQGAIVIFLGTGHGTFTAPSLLGTGSPSFAPGLMVGDFLGTGQAQIAALDRTNGAINFISRSTTSKPPLSRRGGVDVKGNGGSGLYVRKGKSIYGTSAAPGSQVSFSELLSFGDAIFTPYGFFDFHGNGSSQLSLNTDINSINKVGNFWAWDLASVGDSTLLRQVNSAWVVEATGDLDGDGFGDLVFRFTGQTNNPADTGVSYIWFTNGQNVTQVRKRGGAPLNWKLLGTADLDGNGAGDIIYVSPNGAIRALMATPGRTCANLSVGQLPAGFTAVKVADYTARGKGDILIRNLSTGMARLLSMDASGLTLPAPVADPDDPNASCTPSDQIIPYITKILPDVDPNWQYYASGDFNGDGYMDILWKRPDGTLELWLLTENTATPIIYTNMGPTLDGADVIGP